MVKAQSDIFISLIGLEERVLGAFEAPNEILADTYVMLINSEFNNDERVLKYRDKIVDSYLKTKRLHFLTSSYFNGLEIVRQFNELISKEFGSLDAKKILLDASTFNRQNLLILLRLLRITYKVTEIDLIYTKPQTYNENISEGFSRYGSVPFFSGTQLADRKKLLILLVGYEEERAFAVWEKEEPNDTILVEGYKPTMAKFLQRNKDKIAILQSSFGQCKLDKATANDPLQAKNELLRIISQYTGEYNVVISPLNTKLQVVGLYLAWEKYPEIRITQAFPAKFSNWLSAGIGETKLFSL